MTWPNGFTRDVEMNRRPLPDLHNVSRLLIIRLSAIGDVIHALPLASALKDAYPHLEISWLVEEIPADVVLGNPDLKRVIVVPRSRWKQGRTHSPRVWREYLAFLAHLRAQRFDVTIDLQGYAKSALYALATGARYRLGWWRMRDGANLVSRPLPRCPESVHRVDWFLDVARSLGIENPRVRFPLHIPQAARQRVREMLARAGIGPGVRYAVINQAAGNPPRRWGLKQFGALTSQLAQRYRLSAVLIGTLPEAMDCDAIVRQVTTELRMRGVTDMPPPVNLAGKTTLKELAALLEGCSLHISGDTGSTHLAAALGIPVVAFYGSTDPAHAGPWGQSDHVLDRRDLCSPICTIRRCVYAVTGSASVRDGYACSAMDRSENSDGSETVSARCLAAITVEQALTAVDQIIQSLRPPLD